LGLAIVKGFAEAMGLRVTAANRPDGGALCPARAAGADPSRGGAGMSGPGEGGSAAFC
jgi:two-component system sensor histidine kinase KdpD